MREHGVSDLPIFNLEQNPGKIAELNLGESKCRRESSQPRDGRRSSDVSLSNVNGGDLLIQKEADSDRGSSRFNRQVDVSEHHLDACGITHETEERAWPDSTSLVGADFSGSLRRDIAVDGNRSGWIDPNFGNRRMLELNRRSLHRHLTGGGVEPTERMRRLGWTQCDCTDGDRCSHESADSAMRRRRRRSVRRHQSFCNFERVCMCEHVCMCISHCGNFPSGLKLSKTF